MSPIQRRAKWQRPQDISLKFRQFVQEEHAVVPQQHFSRPRHSTSTNQPGIADFRPIRSACCSTVSPTTSSTCFACSCLRRCSQHKSKRCAFNCSRSGRASAKQLVASAFIWPAAGLFGISSKPPRSATPLSLSHLFDNPLSEGQGGAISKNC